ncbi:MAG: glutathione S-transferase N-terminal domain-containing protein, partial [Sulfuricaulis sp.]
LLEFPHSHFCEKARWALDYKGIPFEAVAILPGFHRITVRKYARDSSVPVLLTDAGAVQGASLCRRNIHRYSRRANANIS